MTLKNKYSLLIISCTVHNACAMEKPAAQLKPAAQVMQQVTGDLSCEKLLKLSQEQLMKMAQDGNAMARQLISFKQLNELSLEALLKQAEAGNAEAQYRVGECYRERQKGAERSQEKALLWFAKAADQGHVYAAWRAGVNAQNAKKFDLAEKYLMQAAKAHEPLSIYELACSYKSKNVWGRETSLEQEAIWLEKMLQGINPDIPLFDPVYIDMVKKLQAKAACRLAELCEAGYGQVAASKQQALMLYRKALEFNPDDVRAKEGIVRLKPDMQSITSLLTTEAAETHAGSQCLLGMLAYNSQRYDDAVECFRRVIADPVAQYYLGLCCEKGQGTALNEDNAFSYFRQSAEQGNALAIARLQEVPETHRLYPAVLCVLGILRRNGTGLAADGSLAIQLFVRSYAGKCLEALTHLTSMAEKNAEAQYTMGVLNETGQIGSVHKDEAVSWFEKALLNNHGPALDVLIKLAGENNIKAIFVLARYFESKKEYQKCIDWLTRGADGGSAVAAQTRFITELSVSKTHRRRHIT